MRAWLNLRYTVEKRRRAFTRGLKSLGYDVQMGITPDPQEGDILVTWNRIGRGANVAKRFESRNLPVLVAENASWGNHYAGTDWYHIARRYHNTAGCFPVGDNARWDNLGVNLAPFRTEGETVILPQRGIGTDPTRMPPHWPRKALKRHGGRVRKHPGRGPQTPLESDLARCGQVVTWGSGAAIKALMMGIPVKSYMPNWIGEQDNTEQGRLAMFRRLAWAQWTLEEITEGLPFRRLLCES